MNMEAGQSKAQGAGDRERKLQVEPRGGLQHREGQALRAESTGSPLERPGSLRGAGLANLVRPAAAWMRPAALWRASAWLQDHGFK